MTMEKHTQLQFLGKTLDLYKRPRSCNYGPKLDDVTTIFSVKRLFQPYKKAFSQRLHHAAFVHEEKHSYLRDLGPFSKEPDHLWYMESWICFVAKTIILETLFLITLVV